MIIRTYLAFLAARRQEDRAWAESFLENGALSQTALQARLQARTVAIVGNARAPIPNDYVQEIDDHDIVIRMNLAPGFGAPGRGSKIDWLATSIPPVLPKSVLNRLDLIIWMTNKRRRLKFQLWRSGRLSMYPASRNRALREALGARPSTGAMALDLILSSPATAITLYGFDLFQTASLSGSANMAEVPHNFKAEEEWVMSAVKTDPRLIIRMSNSHAGK